MALLPCLDICAVTAEAVPHDMTSSIVLTKMLNNKSRFADGSIDMSLGDCHWANETQSQ